MADHTRVPPPDPHDPDRPAADPADATPEGRPDVVDSDDLEVLRAEILALRDAGAGAEARELVLRDRVRELEVQVEELASAVDRLSAIAHNPFVRAVARITRPARGALGRGRP